MDKFHLLFFQLEIPNSNYPKYIGNDILTNQIIPNFLEVSLLQIQISPNTPRDPQILGFSKFYGYLVRPNLGA